MEISRDQESDRGDMQDRPRGTKSVAVVVALFLVPIAWFVTATRLRPAWNPAARFMAQGIEATGGTPLADVQQEPDWPVRRVDLLPSSPGWRLETSPAVEASLWRQLAPPELLRVEAHGLVGKPTWAARLLYQPVPLLRDRWYQVRFDIRSPRGRLLWCLVADAGHPYNRWGLFREVYAHESWQTLAFRFRALGDVRDAVLGFDLGGSDTLVEIRNVSWWEPADGAPASQGSANGQAMPSLARPPAVAAAAGERSLVERRQQQRDGIAVATQLLTLIEHEGGRARLRHPEGPPWVTRIDLDHLGSGNPWAVQAVWRDVPLEPGEHYRLKLRGRAERSRRVLLTLTEDQAPWSPLGFAEAVTLEPNWQTVSLPLSAISTDRPVRLVFDLAEDGSAVELSDLQLEPVR